jgi:hypothetical protein
VQPWQERRRLSEACTASATVRQPIKSRRPVKNRQSNPR